jgi:hypothetical protein
MNPPLHSGFLAVSFLPLDSVVERGKIMSGKVVSRNAMRPAAAVAHKLNPGMITKLMEREDREKTFKKGSAPYYLSLPPSPSFPLSLSFLPAFLPLPLSNLYHSII